ncbi:hypothetical protein GBA52_004779 [Prunus armeniaca]|nr:hypothetical protein GBA52_004779 [Prunus armeniaca]
MIPSNNTERKHDYLDILDGSGKGDHIQLLQIYECWHQTDYDIDWCEDYQLQMAKKKKKKKKKRRGGGKEE